MVTLQGIFACSGRRQDTLSPGGTQPELSHRDAASQARLMEGPGESLGPSSESVVMLDAFATTDVIPVALFEFSEDDRREDCQRA